MNKFNDTGNVTPMSEDERRRKACEAAEIAAFYYKITQVSGSDTEINDAKLWMRKWNDYAESLAPSRPSDGELIQIIERLQGILHDERKSERMPNLFQDVMSRSDDIIARLRHGK